MTPDMLIPIISSIGWLVLCGAALASYRLHWSQMAKMALVWLAIFVGLYVAVEWFLTVQNTASALL
ncbi:MAG: hypothetical protein NBV60_02865 [Erythrobacter sp.]|nr:hypothetical protein [Erythrobacter sp.]